MGIAWGYVSIRGVTQSGNQERGAEWFQSLSLLGTQMESSCRQESLEILVTRGETLALVRARIPPDPRLSSHFGLLQRVSRLGLCTSHSPACDMALLLTWFPPTLPPGHRVRRASPFGHPRASPGPTPEVEGRPLGLTAVIATCLVSSVTALGLLSGWTVSPLRGEIGSPDPSNWHFMVFG